MNPIKEIDHETRTVREVRVFVRQYVWPDGASSYDVHLDPGHLAGEPPHQVWIGGHPPFYDENHELTDCLTEDSFDHMPSDEEIEQLPVIRPRVYREYPGVFYIRTAYYQKGPYPSRRAANADIRAGRW